MALESGKRWLRLFLAPSSFLFGVASRKTRFRNSGLGANLCDAYPDLSAFREGFVLEGPRLQSCTSFAYIIYIYMYSNPLDE